MDGAGYRAIDWGFARQKKPGIDGSHVRKDSVFAEIIVRAKACSLWPFKILPTEVIDGGKIILCSWMELLREERSDLRKSRGVDGH